MSNVFMYFPFPDYLLDNYANRMEDCLLAVDPELVLDVIYSGGVEGSRGLEMVGHDDLILSVSHGDIEHPDEMYLVTSRGIRVKTANDLADQMMLEGLPKTHQSILLMNCWGGGDSVVKPGAVPRPDGNTASGDIVVAKNGYLSCLASVLAKALGLRGYFSILVGGFPGIINQNYEQITFGAAHVRTQLDHIQWFDSRGQSTAVRTASAQGSSSFGAARQQLGALLHPTGSAAPPRPAARSPHFRPRVPRRPIGGFQPFKP